MSEKDFNTVFSQRLRYYLAKYDMTQNELAKRLNVGTTSVYNWCNGIKSPRMDKVDTMCSIFNCRRSDLIEDKPATQEKQPLYSVDKKEYEHIEKYRALDDLGRKGVDLALEHETERVKQIEAVRGENGIVPDGLYESAPSIEELEALAAEQDASKKRA